MHRKYFLVNNWDIIVVFLGFGWWISDLLSASNGLRLNKYSSVSIIIRSALQTWCIFLTRLCEISVDPNGIRLSVELIVLLITICIHILIVLVTWKTSLHGISNIIWTITFLILTYYDSFVRLLHGIGIRFLNLYFRGNFARLMDYLPISYILHALLRVEWAT